MFTGLIEQVGTLAARKRGSGGAGLGVRHSPWNEPLRVGDSVAVQGVCLTVTRCRDGEFDCDVLDETLERTDLGCKRPGARLNLERAVRADGRLGGHWVTGHVDGVGRVLGWTAAGRDRVLEVGADECLMAAIAPKGSIACAGVSLTVVAVRGTSFTVHLIPHTLEQTTLGELQPGDPVNLETDLIAKYVGRYLERARAARGLTVDALRRAGFGVGEGEGS